MELKFKRLKDSAVLPIRGTKGAAGIDLTCTNITTTLNEANQKVKQFKEKFNTLLEKYAIGTQNLVVTCYDLIELIKQQPDNSDLQYLYFCIVTDVGLLNNILANRTEEQEII